VNPTFALSYSTPLLGADPDRLVTVARHAEKCGFDALYVPEHVAIHSGAQLGSWAIPPTLPFPDPLEILTFVAASTERLLLGTAVLLLPYHHPVTLAKRLATIDVLSRGRMRLLTIGVGALPGEAAAVGVKYRTRGRRTDEAIDVLRDPDRIAYTRMGHLEMSPEYVERLARDGVTRVVVGVPDGEPEEQCAQLTAFAERFGLGSGNAS
jgi:alkanesulfonate monooxygenase SsuD/methylene tetrahydromethanopterin reductase-like flavin-dependent oxidoreductase (luciferase family)